MQKSYKTRECGCKLLVYQRWCSEDLKINYWNYLCYIIEWVHFFGKNIYFLYVLSAVTFYNFKTGFYVSAGKSRWALRNQALVSWLSYSSHFQCTIDF